VNAVAHPNRSSGPTAVSLVGLAVAAALFVALNVLAVAAFQGTRLDLTADRLFTLSEGTRRTLAKIDEPITLEFVFSERLGREVPLYGSYARRVTDMLDEIATASAGKVVLRTMHPQPFSDEEDRAVSLGLQGIPIDQGGELVYFGIAGTNSTDDREVIPFFQPERENLLEYDLVKMIYALANPQPKTLGIMSSLPIMGDMEAQMRGGVSVPWAIAQPLRQLFSVFNMPFIIDDMPENISVLMLVHPTRLNDRSLYEIEQFLFRGGHAVIFVDPRSESDRAVGPNDISSSTDSLAKLFDKWGISVPEDKFVGDRTLAVRVNAGTAQRVIPAEYVAWLDVQRDTMNQDDPVTSQVGNLNLASVGSIARNADAPVSVEPLIRSSADSASIDVERVRGFQPDILGLLNGFKPDNETYTLAARISGEVETAFPDGPPARTVPKSAGEAPDRPHLARSNGPINVILVADSDLLADQFWIRKQQFLGREVAQPIASNATFVTNAVENLIGSDELISLRSRGVSQRPFDRIVQLEREASLKYRDKERELQDKLEELQKKVAELESVETKTDPTTGELKVVVSMTPEQREALERQRREMVSIRKQLRDVQRELREDVEALQANVQFINIGLMPLVVGLIAIIVGLARVARRRRAYLGG
jgi:ABC-type uncharacterized transport system involved in gliding motility auxiliary subunit